MMTMNERPATPATRTAPVGQYYKAGGRRLWLHTSASGGPAVVFVAGGEQRRPRLPEHPRPDRRLRHLGALRPRRHRLERPGPAPAHRRRSRRRAPRPAPGREHPRPVHAGRPLAGRRLRPPVRPAVPGRRGRPGHARRVPRGLGRVHGPASAPGPGQAARPWPAPVQAHPPGDRADVPQDAGQLAGRHPRAAHRCAPGLRLVQGRRGRAEQHGPAQGRTAGRRRRSRTCRSSR